MPSELLINAINSTINSGTCDQKVLAISALAHLPDSEDLLEQCLFDQDGEMVISACHALKQRKSVNTTLLIQMALEHPETDVRLASLEVLSIHGRGREYTDALLTLLSDECEQWLDDWDSSLDIQLQAAKNLLSQPHSFSEDDVQQLIDRYQDDPEPELAQTLCYLIVKVKPEWLTQQIKQATSAQQRQIVKALQDKAALYRATKSADPVVKRIVIQRLAKLDAREYLQDFLLWLNDADFDIFRCSADKLAEWNYPVSHQHLKPLISSGRHKLDCALPLLGEQAFLQLNQIWQSRQLPPYNLPAYLRLAQKYNQLSDELLTDYYQRFFGLETWLQLESLQILTADKTLLLPVAFLRQCLESEALDNSVRRLLIAHLTNTKSEPHNDYLKSLYFPAHNRIDAQEPAGEIAVTAETNEAEDIQQTSTLSALLNQSKTRQPEVSYDNPLPQELEHFEPLLQHQQERYSGGRKNKVARIEPLSAQALARQLCSHREWIEQALKTSADINVLKACIQFGISYASVRSSELDSWLFNSESDVEKQLLTIEWLDDSIPETFIQKALDDANPALTVKAIGYCQDKQQLNSLLNHPFIDVKKQAFKQLLTQVADQPEQLEPLITKALDSDELVDLISAGQLEANEELLSEQMQEGSLTALAAAVWYLEEIKGS